MDKYQLLAILIIVGSVGIGYLIGLAHTYLITRKIIKQVEEWRKENE